MLDMGRTVNLTIIYRSWGPIDPPLRSFTGDPNPNAGGRGGLTWRTDTGNSCSARESTVRTGIIELGARALKLSLLARSSAFFLSSGLRRLVFAVLSPPPNPREEISDVLVRDSIVPILTVSQTIVVLYDGNGVILGSNKEIMYSSTFLSLFTPLASKTIGKRFKWWINN